MADRAVAFRRVGGLIWTVRRGFSRLGVLLLAALSALLLAVGALLTLAGVADYQTRAFLADWEARGTAPSARAWDVAHDAAQRALAYHPGPNGAYLERLGLVHAWRHFGLPPGAPDAQASRLAARDALRAATQARPSAPLAWAGLAHTKLLLLEFDAELPQAMAQAVHQGPWRPDVNRRVAETGFIAWPQLDAQTRTLSLEAARRALESHTPQPAGLLALAMVAGQRTTLCTGLTSPTQARLKQHCPQAAP